MEGLASSFPFTRFYCILDPAAATFPSTLRRTSLLSCSGTRDDDDEEEDRELFLPEGRCLRYLCFFRLHLLLLVFIWLLHVDVEVTSTSALNESFWIPLNLMLHTFVCVSPALKGTSSCVSLLSVYLMDDFLRVSFSSSCSSFIVSLFLTLFSHRHSSARKLHSRDHRCVNL